MLHGSAECAFAWSFVTHVFCVVVARLLYRYRVLAVVSSLSGRGGQFCPIGIAEIQSRVAETQIRVLRALRGDWVDKLGSYSDSHLSGLTAKLFKSQVVRVLGL